MSHSLAHENLSGLRNDRPDAALVKLPSMYDQEQNGPLPKYRFTKACSQRSAVPILCAAAAGGHDGGEEVVVFQLFRSLSWSKGSICVT